MKTNKFLKKLPAVLILVSSMFILNTAHAQTTYTWTGLSTSGFPYLWDDPTNWTQTGGSGSGSYPGDGLGGGTGNQDAVEITSTGGGANPTIDVSVSIGSLQVDNDATLLNDGAHALTTVYSVGVCTGDVVIGPNFGDAAAVYDLSNGTIGTSPDLIVGGSISGYGNLNLFGTGQTIQVAKDFTVSGFRPNDGGDFGSTLEFTGSGAESIDATLTTTTGAYTFDNLKIDNGVSGATFICNPASDFEIDGNLSGGGILHTGATQIILVGDMSIGIFDVGANHEILQLWGFIGNLGNGYSSQTQQINSQTFYTVQNWNFGTILTGSITVTNNLDFELGNWDLTVYSAIIQHGATLSWNNNGIQAPTDANLSSYGYFITDGAGTVDMDVNATQTGFPIGYSSSELTPITFNYTTTPAPALPGRLDVRVFPGVKDKNGVLLSTTTMDAVNYEWVATPENTKLDYQVSTHWNSGTDELSSMTETGVFLAYRHQDPGTVGTPHIWTPLGPTSGGPTSDQSTFSANNADQDSIAAAATVSIGTDNPIGVTYIATGSSPVSLPVSLLTFGAQYQNGQVNLNWTTASEQNNAYFDIERSTNAANWTSIGQVQGHGTTDQMNSYISVDNLAGVIPTGSLYYRLKQVDFNGKFTYSMIRTVDLSNPGPSVATYPNPTSNVLNVNWTSASDDNAVLRLVNMSGVSVYEQNVSGKGLIQQKIDMSTLPSGVYYLQIISNNSSTVNQPVFKN